MRYNTATQYTYAMCNDLLKTIDISILDRITIEPSALVIVVMEAWSTSDWRKE